MDPRVAEVLAIIQKHPNTCPESLAASVHLSASRLRHLFFTESTLRLYAHLKEQRLLSAQTLLLTGHQSVKEVCAAAGFGNTNHFVREFHKRFGMAPAAYRRAATFRNK